MKRRGTLGGVLQPMSPAAARRAAAAAAVARSLALLLVLAVFAGGLRLSPHYSAVVQRLPASLQRRHLDVAPGGRAARLRDGTAATQQQQQLQGQDRALSFAVCGDFAEQRIALVSGGGA